MLNNPWEDVYSDDDWFDEHDDLLSQLGSNKDVWDDEGNFEDWLEDDFEYYEYYDVPPQLCADEDVWDDDCSCDNEHWLKDDNFPAEFDAEDDQRSTKAFCGSMEMIVTALDSIAFAHSFASLQFLRRFEVPKHFPRTYQRLQMTTPAFSHIFIKSWSGTPRFCRPFVGCQPGLTSHLIAKFAGWAADSKFRAVRAPMSLMILDRAFEVHRRLAIFVKVRFILCSGECEKHVRMLACMREPYVHTCF